MSKPRRLNVEEVIFFCCDQQQGFAKFIYGFETIIGAAKQLVKIASVLNLPILVTEQSPEKFGHIIPEIKKELPLNHCETFTKTTFSMINDQTKEFLNRYPHRKTAVLFGGETHICIQQTALDLLSLGYTVFLITDGISSVRRLDRTTAFRRLEAEGALLITSESAIFDLIRTADHPDFKKLLPIIKIERFTTIAKL